MAEKPAAAPGNPRRPYREKGGAAARLSLTAVSLLVLLLLPARAQVGSWLDDMASAMRWKIGPFLANAALVLENAGYDSDVFYRSATTNTPDIRFGAGPDVQILLPLRDRGAIVVNASPRYEFYAKTRRLRTLNNALNGSFRYTFGKISLSGSASLRNALLRLNTELPIDVRLNTNSEDGRIHWQLTRTESLSVGFRTSYLDYGSEAFEGLFVGPELNRRENLVDVTTSFQPNPKTRFYVTGDYGTARFTEEASRFRDSRSYSARGGVEFAPPGLEDLLTTGLQGIVNVGYKVFELIASPGKPYGGLVGDTALSIGLEPRTAVRGYFSRDIQYSIFSTNAFFVQTAYGGGIVRYLTKRVALAYNVLYSMNRYPQGSPGAEGPLDRYGRYLTHIVRLDWRARRYLEIGLVGHIGWRSTDPRVAAKYRYFIGLNVVYGSMPQSSLRLSPLGF